MSGRRRIATGIALIGALFVASRLVERWPRDVDVTYEAGPGVAALDVDYLYEEEAVASVRFRAQDDRTPRFRHIVRLHPGEYRVQITLHGRDGRVIEEARTLVSPSASAVRFDLSDLGATE